MRLGHQKIQILLTSSLSLSGITLRGGPTDSGSLMVIPFVAGVVGAAVLATLIGSAVMVESSSAALVGLEASESFLTNLLSSGTRERLLSFLNFFFLPLLESLDFVSWC